MKRLSPMTLALVVLISLGAASFAIPQAASKTGKSPGGNAAVPQYVSAKFQDRICQQVHGSQKVTSPPNV